jgi:pimeloyl-ACP methyl ester carboxylesterase
MSPATGAARRAYVEAAGRRVHIRICGGGPPLVMLHGSPGDGEMLAAEMTAAARAGFTALALDTPGFGGSEALLGDRLEVRDLAAATAETLRALGLPPCRVYGTHTGAAIAAELARGWPAQVTGLLLEGLPVFTPEETERLFGQHFAPMIPDPLGGHLISTWMRFRDQFTWFPWAARRPEALNPVDRPSAADIDLWVSMFYRSFRTYGPAYRAACSYGPLAAATAEALDRPTIFMASAEDMLFPHLDRLPALKTGQSVVRLRHDPQARLRAIGALARSLPGPVEEGRAWRPPSRGLVGGEGRLGYIDTEAGQVMVRAWGDPSNPPMMYLHDGLGTGRSLTPIAPRLAQTRYVIAPDLPGSGQSDSPQPSQDRLDVSAQAVATVAGALGIEDVVLAGQGVGCLLAGRAAARAPVRALVLHEPPPANLSPSAFAPRLPLSPDGRHWVQAWLMVRDGEIYHPWCDGRVAAQRRTPGLFDPDFLHEETVALMRSRSTYHLTPRLALGVQGAAAAPAGVAVRTTTGPGREALVAAILAAAP